MKQLGTYHLLPDNYVTLGRGSLGFKVDWDLFEDIGYNEFVCGMRVRATAVGYTRETWMFRFIDNHFAMIE